MSAPFEPAAEGRKDDAGKDPWHLAPWDAFRAIVKVLRHGETRYGARNWEAGMAWSRPYAAAMRHLTAWWEGEKADPETGYSHLWHAGCCVVFLIAYELRCAGTDDRPSYFGPFHARPSDPERLVPRRTTVVGVIRPCASCRTPDDCRKLKTCFRSERPGENA